MIRLADRSTRRFAAVAAAVLACYALAGDDVRAWLSAGGAVLAATVAGGRSWRRPQQRAVWAVLAVALLANAIADLVYTVMQQSSGAEPPFPSWPDVFYLAFYPLFGTGLFLLARRRGRERSALIDATIVAVGTSVVVWQFLIAPIAGDAEVDALSRLVSVGYPVGDVVLLAFLSRLVFGAGDDSGTVRLLAAGAGTLLVADIGYLAIGLYGTYSPGAWTDAAYLVAYLVIGAAALAPERPPREAARARRRHVGWGRLVLLTGATLLAPGVAIASNRSLELPALASALLFLLVMARIAGLLRTLAASGERRFESLVINSSEWVAIVQDGAVAYASPSMQSAIAAVAAAPAGAGAGAGVDTLAALVHPEDLPGLRDALDRCAAAAARTVVDVEFRARVGGSWRAMAAALMNLTDEADVHGVVVNAHDVHELRQLASFDPLTGLSNRSSFAVRLAAAVAAGEAATVLLFDLDGFKEVNDSLGHHAGDSLLRATAARLREAAGPDAVVARLGGDEFAVLQRHANDAEARRVAALALQLLRQPVEVDGVAVGVSASIGIARRPGGAPGTFDVAEDLVRCADIAMYEAKGRGKSRAVLYEEAMGEPVRRRLELRAALDGALAGEQMSLHYQPQFRLDRGGLVGFEALLRWQHPVHGAIAPVEFIAAAEECQHIVTLGHWVLDQALHQLAVWQRSAPEWRQLRMSVNLSPRQLHDPDLVPLISRLLLEHRIPPGSLVLELTEQALIDSPAAAVAVFERLKDLGVRLAIDDYGSGNASIGYLRRFPIDELKIDRSLVTPLAVDAASHAMVRSIIELAGALGLDTVAEGIETDAQAQLLRRLGAGQGQGYLLGRPTDASGAAAVLLEAGHRESHDGAWAQPA